MKFVAAALMLLLLLRCSRNSYSVENDITNHLEYYVMAKQMSANASKCTQYEYHNDSFNCSVIIINELFHHLNTQITSEDDIKVAVFLPGIHFISDTRNHQWSTQSYLNLTMVGIGNVTIICISQFNFLLQNIQYVSIRNLQFKSCTGRSNISSLFTFNITIGLYEDTSMTLSNLHIYGENITGIKINLCRKKHTDYLNSQLTINIINSHVSTKSTGIHIFHPQKPYYNVINKYSDIFVKVFLTLNIVNVSFTNSCFSLELHNEHNYHTSRHVNPVTLLNTKFVGGKCSPVLKFYRYSGDVDITLNNISINNTQARTLVHSIGDYIRFTGSCDFHNNRGNIIFEPTVDKGVLIFSAATVKMLNNKAVQDENVFEISRLAVNVNNSKIIFEDNVGKNCGGITFIDVNVFFYVNTSISFTSNKGEVSGALLLYSSNISFCGTSLNLISVHLSKNKGSVIVGSRSKLNITNTELTIINNTVYGSDIFVAKSTVLVANGSSVTFNDSSVNFISNQGQQCGGTMATNGSHIVFINSSKALFIRNLGELGGAISLSSMSVLQFDHGISITFIENEAQKGGAIFVDDRTYIYANRLQMSAIQKVGAATYLSFSGNMAHIGGNNIYGGWIDWSAGSGNINFTTALWNSMKFNDKDIDTIASDPLRICMCNNQDQNCSMTSWTFQQLYPGDTLDIGKSTITCNGYFQGIQQSYSFWKDKTFTNHSNSSKDLYPSQLHHNVP